MSHLSLNQTLGYYTPAFFQLYIATVNPIDLRNLTDKELTTFIHEYTHFLQDFTTIKGLENIFYTFDWFRLYIKETEKRRKVKLPFHPSNKTMELGIKIRNITWGSQPNPDLDRICRLSQVYREIYPLKPKVLKEHPELKTLAVIKCKGLGHCGEERSFEIGTLAVMESMAHLAEGLMSLPVTNSPDYPYNTVRLLADFLLPATKISDEVLFALCDVALQCSYPGVAIYDMLTEIRNGKIPLPKDGYEVYTLYVAQFQGMFDEKANPLLTMAHDDLIKLVGGPMGERYQAWINNIMTFAKEVRRHNPAFMIDSFRKKSKYAEIVNYIGTPLMVNATDDYSKVPAKFTSLFPLDLDVEFFPALQHIMDMFETGVAKCSMYDWCIQSGIKTDKNCIINPMAHANPKLYKEFCVVGGLWYSWKMKRYQLKAPVLFRPICK